MPATELACHGVAVTASLADLPILVLANMVATCTASPVLARKLASWRSGERFLWLAADDALRVMPQTPEHERYLHLGILPEATRSSMFNGSMAQQLDSLTA